MGTWRLALMPLIAGAVALELYAQGFTRLRRRRRELAGWRNAALFTTGVLVAVLALVSPIDQIGEDKLLSVHMLQHLLLADVAPLLIVLGLRGPVALFLLPQRPFRALARMQPLRALLTLLLRPWVSFGTWCAALGGWHIPAAYDAALQHPALHVVEHTTFVLAGLLVWTQIIDPTRQGHLSPGRRAVFAGGVLLAGMVLSEVLLLTGPLYAYYTHIVHRPFGLTADEDQNRAALLMMAEQIATLGSAAALLLWSHAERVEEETRAQT